MSLLCQSKNSKALNTFHPSSGRGLTIPLEKCRETLSVLRLVILHVGVSGNAIKPKGMKVGCSKIMGRMNYSMYMRADPNISP